MPGSITPLPILLELEEEDRKTYEKLEPPKSVVVRYGYQRLIAELPYDGTAKPGCGSKMVIRTGRGIEVGEMLTTTCANAGCGKSVSRKDMLQYFENSGGRDYPFTEQGKVLRVATVEDLADQARLDARKTEIIKFARILVVELGLPLKLVDVELLLGGERIIFHYTAEQWVDFRELVRRLATEYQTRIEMHQVNAREEARLVADYERCGQYCCCKQFLKVLKPVSMRSAKVQKATLDPTKISGRCGRLMCCLRYEDETYEALRKKLPHRQTRVMTDEGSGTVLDSQILTQLVLIRLDKAEAPGAFPVENIRPLTKEEDVAIRAELQAAADAAAEKAAARWSRSARGRAGEAQPPPTSRGYGNRRQEPPPAKPQAAAEARDEVRPQPVEDAGGDASAGDGGEGKRRRRRRGRRRRGGEGGTTPDGGEPAAQD